jgi:hypothetical protein
MESVRGSRTPQAEMMVVVTIPNQASEEWLTSDTVSRAKQLRNAQLFVDIGGVEACRFGAVTSGAVMLFDPAGVCKYAGGVTMARGHEGDNAGRLAVAGILRGEVDATPSLPAFGCRLCLPETKSLSAPGALQLPSHTHAAAY